MDVKAIENLNIDRVLQRGTGKIIEQRQDAFAEKLECYQVAYYHTEMPGFVGEHLEGSIGLLHVMPKFRRKGYAMELENAMIRKNMEAGFLPFGQVEKSNTASMALQKKMGMMFASIALMVIYSQVITKKYGVE